MNESNKISAKETIAKLMASENILVEHANVSTASFDLINRRLLLPNWKDISDSVYTLLITHEVGHALYTPTQEYTALVIEPKKADLKQVINIVEDVRIEKLIQAKYPGTQRAFKAGYNELVEKNFFGTKERSIRSYGLLDRINLHFKIGHFGYAKVPFTEEEQVWVDRVASCKSFAEVVALSEELKKFAEESEENPQSSDEQQPPPSPSNSTQEQGEQSDNHTDSEKPKQETQSSSGDNKEEGEEKPSNESGGSSSGEENKQQDPSDTLDAGQSPPAAPTDKAPLVETQAAFDNEIRKCVDPEIQQVTYMTLPKFDLTDVIVPYKVVHSQIRTYYKGLHHFSTVLEFADRVKASNKQTVNQLANIFEMKKRAKLDVRALTSKTGKLDTNKIHSYRYNDDVFKKSTTIPEGKSHGLVMFLDMSSSMFDNMAGTYEQLINLVLFCRRASIPFDVYGFTDSPYAKDKLGTHGKRGEVSLYGGFCLRHYFSHRMSAVEFSEAIQNVSSLLFSYRNKYTGIPKYETLNQTPLVPAILAATTLIPKFKADNNLDIVNAIFLTDGDDGYGIPYLDNNGERKSCWVKPRSNGSLYYSDRQYYRFYLRDAKTLKQYEIKNSTSDCFNILRELTGARVIGFHLISRKDAVSVLGRTYDCSVKLDEQLKSFKNQKFAEINNQNGYDAYYLIPSGNSLIVGSGEFEGDLDTTVDWDNEKEAKKVMRAVTKEFNEFMKNRVVNRVFLNRFIENIA